MLLNYRFNRNVVWRAAWTNTLSRPDYGDLIPYESSLDPEGLLNLDSGALEGFGIHDGLLNDRGRKLVLGRLDSMTGTRVVDLRGGEPHDF